MRLLTITSLPLLALAVWAPSATAQDLVLEHISDNPATATDLNVDAFAPLVSKSGTRVFFITTERLLLSDSDNAQDVYARNTDGSLSHLSDGPFTPDPALDASLAGASADGTRVFIGTSERLWQFTDTDASADVYAREADGSITQVSDHPTTLTDVPQDAFFAGAADDGSRVFFTTPESMAGGDTDTAAIDVYARDADGNLSFMTGSPVNPDPEIDVFPAGTSADGTRFFFTSTEPRGTFTDTDGATDLYARNAGGTLSHVSDHPTTNPDAEEAVGFGGASADGSRVLFFTPEKMLSSDTDSVHDAYARNADGTLSHLSDEPEGGPDAAAEAVPHALSADGKRAIFDTRERLLRTDTDGALDFYARNIVGGLTHLSDHPTTALDAESDAVYRTSSADGSRVMFTTPERLLPSDTDPAGDVYARNADGTLTHLSDHPSTEVDNAVNARSVTTSADGTRVTFRTEEPMLPSDTDNTDDVYLVRPAAPSGGGPGGGGETPGGGAPSGSGGGAEVPAADRTVPVVGGLTMARSFRAASAGGPIAAARAVGTTVRYGLSEPATATFTVERPTAGRLVGRVCRKPSRKPSRRTRKRRKCTRYVRVGKPFTHAGVVGTNAFKFTGRPGRKLAPGGYRLTVAAADAAGNKSKPKSRGFKITRR